MKRRTRYTVLLLGALFFLIAAPIIVFYVGGIRYNFGDNEYAKTGILSVEANPKKVTVTLDDTTKDETPVNFRFLIPKEYNVTLSQIGYWDWSKRLEVKAGKATIASNALDKIHLLKRNTLPVVINDQVTDFSLHGSNLIYLTDTNINLIDASLSGATKTIALGSNFNQLATSGQGNYFLLTNPQQTLLLNVNAWRLVNITSLVNNVTDLQITDSGLILGRRADVLVSIDPATQHETALLPQVTVFSTLNQNLYYLQITVDANKNSRTMMAVVPLASAGTVAPQIILDDVPANLATGKLLITQQKDVVLFANNSLYKVNNALDLIADNVEQLYFDPIAPTLLYTAHGQLQWFEFTANKNHLITRNTQAISAPQISTPIGYAFYLQNNVVQAMELDTTDHQNNYPLLPTTAGKSLRLDVDARNLFILDGQKLEILNIR